MSTEQEQQAPPPKRKPAKVVPIDQAVAQKERGYHVPLNCRLEDVKQDLERYGCMEHERAVYVLRETADARVAVQVANFTCTINTHMMDQEQPTKLITIVNKFREQLTIEVPSDALLTLMGFRKAVDVGGNFVFTGTEGDYMRYQQLMKDRMAKGRKLEIMGRQREGIYAFSNAALSPSGQLIEYDRNGCFTWDGASYYVPAGNQVWANDDTKHQTAKLVRLEDSGITFRAWNQQLRTVFKEHSLLASVFTIAGLFCNELRQRLGGFPLLFLYGQAGAGKDELISMCQAISGRPAGRISLTGPNTDKAQFSMLAEVDSIGLHLAEYRSGMDTAKVEFCKAVWDRQGYKRRDRNMGVSTNTMPIRAYAFMSGNDYPSADDALLTRLIVEEMHRTKHSWEDKKQFNQLKQMQVQGYSNLLTEVWAHREGFLGSVWQEQHPMAQELLDSLFNEQTLDSRMLANASALLSTFLYFERRLAWSFNRLELLDRIREVMLRQQRQRSTSGEVATFWTCFIHGVREGRLQLGRHFRLEQNGTKDIPATSILFFWDEVFSVYAETHRRVFNQPARTSSTLLGKMEHHDSYLGPVRSCRIGDRKSSAYAFDYTKVGTDLIGLLMDEPELAEKKPAEVPAF